MQLHIKLSASRDAALIAALQAIPPGTRAERIRDTLTQGFVGSPDLAKAVYRLAAVLEHLPNERYRCDGESAEMPPPATKPLLERMKDDPALGARVKQSVLGGWEKIGPID